MSVAVAHPTGHRSSTNRWLVAAVVVLAAALVGVSAWAVTDRQEATVAPAAAASLDVGTARTLVMDRQDAMNAGDPAALARFYAGKAVMVDLHTDTRIDGADAIAAALAGASNAGYKYRSEGDPLVVAGRYIVNPFSLVSPTQLDKHGPAAFMNVLEIQDGKIVREWASGMYYHASE